MRISGFRDVLRVEGLRDALSVIRIFVNRMMVELLNGQMVESGNRCSKRVVIANDPVSLRAGE